MKKRLLSVALVVVMAVWLCGCGEATQETTNAYNSPSFILAEWGKGYKIVYHKETKVMYVINTNSTTEVFTLLINADGTPMLYETED